eukprot:ANDGO_07390.mRNA.1 Lariat debranching enzyme
MRVAVIGCVHGQWSDISCSLTEYERTASAKIDLVLLCGDLQSVRNDRDLASVHVKPKYRTPGSFSNVVSGVLPWPWFTVAIGGNHEASAFLSQLPFGGWIAEHVWYLGHGSAIRLSNGLVIAGISGIESIHTRHALQSRSLQPQDQSDVAATATEAASEARLLPYHIRYGTVQCVAACGPGIVDVCLSHDWPRCMIPHCPKSYLREDPDAGSTLLDAAFAALQSKYWFCAHHHVKCAVVHEHVPNEGADRKSPFTRFLALDKILPGRQFMQVLDFPDFSFPENVNDVSVSLFGPWVQAVKNRVAGRMKGLQDVDMSREDWAQTSSVLTDISLASVLHTWSPRDQTSFIRDLLGVPSFPAPLPVPSL